MLGVATAGNRTVHPVGLWIYNPASSNWRSILVIFVCWAGDVVVLADVDFVAAAANR
jgi:hypothetical protein